MINSWASGEGLVYVHITIYIILIYYIYSLLIRREIIYIYIYNLYIIYLFSI